MDCIEPQQPVCSDGEKEFQACGNRGMQNRTCNGCNWGPWTACKGGGVCASGQQQTESLWVLRNTDAPLYECLLLGCLVPVRRRRDLRTGNRVCEDVGQFGGIIELLCNDECTYEPPEIPGSLCEGVSGGGQIP